MNQKFYRHSGKLSPSATFLAPILILPSAAIVGALFGYFEFLAHFLPLSPIFLAAILFALITVGVAIGYYSSHILRKFHARSVPATLLLTFLACTITLYFAWVFWIADYLQYFHHNFTFLRLANPIVLWHIVLLINIHGSWGFGSGFYPTGIILAAIWLTEIAIIFGVALSIAYNRATQNVFCEHCKKWGAIRSLMQIHPINSERLRKSILSGSFDMLASAELSLPDEDSWCDVVLEGCPTCDNLQTLTIDRCTRVTTRSNRTKIETKKVIHRLLLTPDQTVTLAQVAAIVTTKPTDTSTDAESNAGPTATT